MTDQPQYRSPDPFDKIVGSLEGRGDVVKSGSATVTVASPLVGSVQTFIVRTYRVRNDERNNDAGDTVTVQYMDADRHIRLAIPPAAVAAIRRQSDALTTKLRRQAGRATAAARKARGEKPAFMKGKR